MEKVSNRFAEVACKRCGVVDRRYDCYYIVYKYAGAFYPVRLDLCGKCWSKLSLDKAIKKVEKEMNGKYDVEEL